MKKIYQTPKMVTMKIASSTILSASDPEVKVDKEESIEAAEVESRSFRNRNLWEEEEEDEQW